MAAARTAAVEQATPRRALPVRGHNQWRESSAGRWRLQGKKRRPACLVIFAEMGDLCTQVREGARFPLELGLPGGLPSPHLVMTTSALAPVDVVLLVAYLLLIVAMGFAVGRGRRDATEYMVGGRSIPAWAVFCSIVSTETSAVTFLSIPGFAYGRDFTWLQLPLGFVLGRVFVAAILLPSYFKGDLFTAYQVLEDRFGGAAKQTASVLFVVTRTLADGLRLFLVAIVLQEMTGLSLGWAVVVMGAITIVYTVFGGMRAVIWADVAQFALYLLGAVVAFWVLLTRVPGGFARVLEIADSAGKLRVLDFGPSLADPYVFWAGIVGGAFLTLGSHGVDQLMVQRYLCARSLRQARGALVASGVFVLAQFAFFLLIGLGLYAFYTLHPPATPFDRTDRVFARFILTEIPHGPLGLVVGALFAAAFTSSLNASATAVVHDLYRHRRPAASSAELMRVARWLTVAFGLAQIAVGLAGQRLKASVVDSVLTIAGFTTGIILGVFLLGLVGRRIHERAALLGMVLGLATISAVAFGTRLAWPWYALVGSTSTFLFGLAAAGFSAPAAADLSSTTGER